ncbi:STAS domain-containing protein [Nocardioides zeae]|uniref:STAS domain-containing protein n=1 Tax=Nocardioides imazamoxiresistens TaxID=3231893 RepID=A0ABU3PYH3_9ACTN|nr:STAS domain-containing protein [Nocardioides zeae]MDT9594226.1 STAS domain-containing protein [Nocardioides zeae]
MSANDDSLVIETAPETGVLRLTGGIYDQQDLEKLDLELTSASAGFTAPVTVDLGALEFLPSLAVGTLVALDRRAREGGGSLTLVAENGSLAHRILTVVGVPVTTP